MLYKRRLVPGIRDFPKGCGVVTGHHFTSVSSLKQSELKSGTVQPRRDFSKITKESLNYSETESSGVEGLDSSWDVAKEEPVIESNGYVQSHLKKEVVDESECTKERKASPVKKRKLSVQNSSNMEVKTDVSNTSKIAIVVGLAATSTCPWRQPKKQGSRQEKKRRWFL